MSILTLNLGLLGLAMTSSWRIAINPHAGARVVAAPALLAACDSDVMVLQEVYAGGDRRHLQRSLQSQYPFAAEPSRDHRPIGAGLFVLSRFPIVDTIFVPSPCRGWKRHLRRRGFLIVTLETPRSGRVRLMNVHLPAVAGLNHPESHQSVSYRHRELDVMFDLADRLGVDVLAGDFNSGPKISQENYRRVLATGFSDAFAASNREGLAAAGVTWDAENSLNASGRFRRSPSQRIDHVFTRLGPDAWKASSANIVLNERAISTKSGAVCLSDHYGLLVELNQPYTSPILKAGLFGAQAAK